MLLLLCSGGLAKCNCGRVAAAVTGTTTAAAGAGAGATGRFSGAQIECHRCGGVDFAEAGIDAGMCIP